MAGKAIAVAIVLGGMLLAAFIGWRILRAMMGYRTVVVKQKGR